jgi:hypothetical protein
MLLGAIEQPDELGYDLGGFLGGGYELTECGL